MAANTQGFDAHPAPLTLTITDDEMAPTVRLELSTTTVPEDGGSTTVIAIQSHPSSEPTTLTVTTAVVALPAVAADFTQSGDTLTIAALATTSTGTVTVTGINNDVDHDPGIKEVEVSATAVNTQGVAGNPAALRFELADDDVRGFEWMPASLTTIEDSQDLAPFDSRADFGADGERDADVPVGLGVSVPPTRATW